MSLIYKIVIVFLWVPLGFSLMPHSPGGLRPVHADPGGVLDGVQELTLKNGIKFLFLPRKGAPVFTAYLRVKVGGVDEPEGQTGIAHLLEHMAFKGTSEIGTKDYSKEKILLEKIEQVHSQILKSDPAKRKALGKTMASLIQKAGELVVKEEFSKIYQRNGATGMNATTSQDLTSYFVTLPTPKLALWAYMESSRLKDPVFREFYSERNVVGEERRSRVEDSPFGSLYEAFIQLAFEKSPYRRPTIGYRADIEKLSATDLATFYKKYYVPSNIVGALVGNFKPKKAEAIIRKYFGSIPPGSTPPRPQVTEPEPQKQKEVKVPFDASPALAFGYLKPNMPHQDDYVFDLLEQILCEGRTSRLYRELVVQKKLAQQVMCNPSTPGSRLKNLFFVYASIHKGHRAREILKVFDEQVEDIKENGVTKEELSKAKKNLLSQWYFDLQSNSAIARALSYFEAVGGNWRYIIDHPKKIEAITSQDIQRIVGRYLTPQRRRSAILRPIRGKS